MSDKDDEREDLRANWIAHPYTQMWAEKAPKQEAAALKALLAVCAQSTDPKVLGCYAIWKEKSVFSEWLKLGVKS